MNTYFALTPTKANSENRLHVYTDYDLGGMNWYTGREKPRGYYLYVQPEENCSRDGYNMSTVQLGKGAKMLLREVKRKSKKQEELAERQAEAEMENFVRRVCDRYGLILGEGND